MTSVTSVSGFCVAEIAVLCGSHTRRSGGTSATRRSKPSRFAAQSTARICGPAGGLMTSNDSVETPGPRRKVPGYFSREPRGRS